MSLAPVELPEFGQSFGFKSNLCVRPVARHFLALSLPFSDCPNQGCANHGANVFERFAKRGGRGRRYRRDGPFRVACRSCGARIRLGEAQVDSAIKELNERPRKRLGWNTPDQAFLSEMNAPPQGELWYKPIAGGCCTRN